MYGMRFSPAALSAGAIDKILQDTQQSEINEQAAKQQAQQLNGITATYSSNAIKNSMDLEASATRSNAYGSIGSGIAQGGAEGLAEGYDSYASRDNTLKANGDTATRIDKWQDAVDNSKEADVVAKVGANAPPKVAATPEELLAAKKRLSEADVTKELTDQNKKDIEVVKGSRDVAEKDDCLTKLNKKISKKKKEYEKKIDNHQSTIQRRTDKLRTWGRVAGDLARGFQQANASQAQSARATQEALKAQAQFAVDSGRSNVDGINKDLDNKKSVKDSSIQLLSALIQENRV